MTERIGYMRTFTSYYNELCKKHLKPLGFKGKPQFRYRVVNDMLQYVQLDKVRWVSEYRIYFQVAPLCAGIKGLDVGLFARGAEGDLGWMAGQVFGNYYANEESEEDMEKCAAMVEDAFIRYLLPFFNTAVNCKSAYAASREVYDAKYAGMKNYSILSSDYEMYMLLKTGDYEMALKYAEAFRECCLDTAFGIELVERIRSNDTAWINNLLAQNERKSRITLGFETE
jgi:hypothetical protein